MCGRQTVPLRLWCVRVNSILPKSESAIGRLKVGVEHGLVAPCVDVAIFLDVNEAEVLRAQPADLIAVEVGDPSCPLQSVASAGPGTYARSSSSVSVV